MEECGNFKEELGGYTITKLPDAGNYEYILKNDGILIKLDQYGIVTAQINPPVGEAVFKREEREMGSPVKVLISDGEKVYENFGVYRLIGSLSEKLSSKPKFWFPKRASD